MIWRLWLGTSPQPNRTQSARQLRLSAVRAWDMGAQRHWNGRARIEIHSVCCLIMVQSRPTSPTVLEATPQLYSRCPFERRASDHATGVLPVASHSVHV